MALSILGLVGCMPTAQYRQDRSYAALDDDVPKGTDPRQTPVGLAPPNQALRVAAIEFDDQGELLGTPDQYGFVLKHIGRPPGHGTAGRIVVVFVHGWFHSAAPHDSNLDLFRTMLAVMAKDEAALAQKEHRPPRFVDGVFIAWRGATTVLPGVEYLTFWNRKDTAHRIGERRVTEVILGLRDAAYAVPAASADSPNRFILMGHSFGGALVYSATSQIIANYLLQHPATTALRAPVADAIILFNPAFEAARVEHLLDTASGLDRRLPTLSIFTSKSDRATGWAFPAARIPDALRGSYRSNLANPIMKDAPFSQRGADTYSIGHFDPFITHDLVVAKAGDALCAPVPQYITTSFGGEHPSAQKVAAAGAEDKQDKGNRLDDVQDDLMAAYADSQKVLNFGSTCLVARDGLKKRQLAVFNVSMDADVWDGHGIDQTPQRTALVLNFLEHYIPFSATGDVIPMGSGEASPAPAATLQEFRSGKTRQRRSRKF